MQFSFQNLNFYINIIFFFFEIENKFNLFPIIQPALIDAFACSHKCLLVSRIKCQQGPSDNQHLPQYSQESNTDKVETEIRGRIETIISLKKKIQKNNNID